MYICEDKSFHPKLMVASFRLLEQVERVRIRKAVLKRQLLSGYVKNEGGGYRGSELWRVRCLVWFRDR